MKLIASLAALAMPVFMAAPWWFAGTGLDYARNMQISGGGTKIAMIGHGVDVAHDNLTNASVEYRGNFCTDPVKTSNVVDEIGTAYASLLVSKNKESIAPAASLVSYGVSGEGCDAGDQVEPDVLAKAFQAALDADPTVIIITSELTEATEATDQLFLQAVRNEVPVITTMAGTRSSMVGASVPVVGVDSAGDPIHEPIGNQVALSAPGQGVDVPGMDGIQASGDGVATLFVGGYVALAQEKWPEAKGSQLVQSLIRTARLDEWRPEVGYGPASLPTMLEDDPTKWGLVYPGHVAQGSRNIMTNEPDYKALLNPPARATVTKAPEIEIDEEGAEPTSTSESALMYAVYGLGAGVLVAILSFLAVTVVRKVRENRNTWGDGTLDGDGGDEYDDF